MAKNKVITKTGEKAKGATKKAATKVKEAKAEAHDTSPEVTEEKAPLKKGDAGLYHGEFVHEVKGKYEPYKQQILDEKAVTPFLVDFLNNGKSKEINAYIELHRFDLILLLDLCKLARKLGMADVVNIDYVEKVLRS